MQLYSGKPLLHKYRPPKPQINSTVYEKVLHAMVQMFARAGQMVESIFVATHSSFFAIVGVVDLLG